MQKAATLLCAVIALGACKEPAPIDGTGAGSAEVAGDTWAGCEELKSKIAGDKLVFTEPTYAGEIATWQITFWGATFRLPQGKWDVMPSRKGDGWSIVLAERDTKDFVVFSSDPQTDEKKPGGTAATMHEQLTLAYKHTKADITCAKAAQKDEQILAAALVLKNVAGPGERNSVHHDMHGLGDIAQMITLPEAGRSMWEVWFPVGDQYVQAAYQFGDRARADALAASGAVAKGIPKDTVVDAGGPEWLAALEAALGAPDQHANWKLLHTKLEKSGASEKSLAAVALLAEKPRKHH